MSSPGSGSAPCNRDSSMSSRTNRPSRLPSRCMRCAKRATVSGSSAASSTASASSVSAPTGVFSSWETLATKSRRTASKRWASVTSSSSSTTALGRSSPASWTGAAMIANAWPSPRRADPVRGGCSTVTARGVAVPEATTSRASSRSCGVPRRSWSMTPSRRAAGLASTTNSSRSTTTTPLVMTETTCSHRAARREVGAGVAERRRADRVLRRPARTPRPIAAITEATHTTTAVPVMVPMVGTRTGPGRHPRSEPPDRDCLFTCWTGEVHVRAAAPGCRRLSWIQTLRPVALRQAVPGPGTEGPSCATCTTTNSTRSARRWSR